MDVRKIQKALQDSKLDGWLFYDFHDRDPIAARVLQMDRNRPSTRRWFYFIPANGTPQKLVHQIEAWRCDHLPGDKHVYLSWQQQHSLLQGLLKDMRTVAMQYSPMNAIPYVSLVDAGTIDLVRSFGINVVSSGDLVGQFEAHLSMEDWKSHQKAGEVMQKVKDDTFKEIADRIKKGEYPSEFDIQQFMHDEMRQNNMTWPDGPIVAINENAADPHFEPTAENSFKMKKGDLVLLDLWAKKNTPGSIYYDITWMGFIGETVPEKMADIFAIICNARETAVDLIRERFKKGEPIYGWEVDKTCRGVIEKAGYGDYFVHRTGHNIGEEVHGNGVHMDNLETKDERKLLPGTCFSIEPGIYLPEKKMGFRTEIDVFITEEGQINIFGDIQTEILPLLGSE